MDLENTIRNLIKRELAADMRASLAGVSRHTGIDYKRLWSFMQEEKPGRLAAAEAQQIYEKLTKRPLLSNVDDL